MENKQEEAKDTLVLIQNLSKRFPQSPSPAINQITLSIPKQGIIGLVGPDGAGKTTLLRLLTSLLLPTEGSISIGGLDTVKNASDISSLIGYMPQKFGLYEDLTVMQNLNLYADLQTVLGKERQERIEQLLSFTQLGLFTDRKAKALSGGMKQKLGLACSLLRKPPLLLLDEPSVGVDPLSRRELWKMVQNLVQSGIAAIWSTSYLDEAEKCDQVILLSEGNLLYYGPPKKLTNRVDGRVFTLSHFVGNRRELTEKALEQENVFDVVIQGEALRFVTKEKKDPPIDLQALSQSSSLQLEPATPRFEDAFIDLLGGSPAGPSPLASLMQKVPPEREFAVEAYGLTKKFGSFTAVNDISFSVKSGEIFGLLGPNGAGKSTTFKMMCGLLKPTAGKALVNGINLQEAPGEGRSHLGYMSQKFSLYGILSVRQNLDFFSGIYNVPRDKRKAIINKLVEIFGFGPFLEETVNNLPLGFKQRLALSCAIMHKPKVLFLDEPTSGVDPLTRREFWSHINGAVEKGGTVVITTHFMDEAEYCDRIGLVYKSRMIRMGTPDELKASVATKTNPNPTLEDAFIQLIEQFEAEHAR